MQIRMPLAPGSGEIYLPSSSKLTWLPSSLCQVLPASTPEMLKQREGSKPHLPHPLPLSLPPGIFQAECTLCVGTCMWSRCWVRGQPGKTQNQNLRQGDQVEMFLDCGDPWVTFTYLCFLNRLTFWSQRVPLGQDLARTICDQFQSCGIWAVPCEGEEAVPNGLCVVWGGALCSIPPASEVCLSLQVQPCLAGNCIFIAPD